VIVCSKLATFWTAQNSFGSHSRYLRNRTIDQDKSYVQAGKEVANTAYKEVMMALLQEKEKEIDQENFHELMDPSKDQIEYWNMAMLWSGKHRSHGKLQSKYHLIML
jgi:hypothetical protein